MARKVEYGIVKLDVNGRVRIPAELRDKCGWTKGQPFKVEFDEETKKIILTPLKEATLKYVTESGDEIEVKID